MLTRLIRSFSAIGLAALGAASISLAATSQHPGYTFAEVHPPDATGKVYLDRFISHVMGHQGAGWLERPEREREEQPTTMIELMDIQPGDHVADIGVGTGYHTRRIAPIVGDAGQVYAVDIQPEMLTILQQGLAADGIDNVTPVLGEIDDPKLPAGSIDLAFMVDVYHEFSHPYEMIAALSKALKPGGRLVLVEYRKEDPSVPIKPSHKMTAAQIRKEMAVHPLEHVSTDSTSLPWQHVAIFRKVD
jgi:SAM-dependent methyltransferase